MQSAHMHCGHCGRRAPLDRWRPAQRLKVLYAFLTPPSLPAVNRACACEAAWPGGASVSLANVLVRTSQLRRQHSRAVGCQALFFAFGRQPVHDATPFIRDQSSAHKWWWWHGQWVLSRKKRGQPPLPRRGRVIFLALFPG